MNYVNLIGNVGNDPEFGENNIFIKFSLCTVEHYTDKKTGETKEIKDWHKIVVFSPYVIKCISNEIKKGCKVAVVGALKTRKWEKDGKPNYITEVIVNVGHCHDVVVSAYSSPVPPPTNNSNEAAPYNLNEL